MALKVFLICVVLVWCVRFLAKTYLDEFKAGKLIKFQIFLGTLGFCSFVGAVAALITMIIQF